MGSGVGGARMAVAMASSNPDTHFQMFLLDNIVSSIAPLMKPEVWSRMPFDLLEKVLLRLPLASQARFRVVSKAARWLLSSENFRVQSAEVALSSGRLPVAAFVRSDELSGEGAGGLSDLGVPYKVHKLSLSFLPAEFRMFNDKEKTANCGLHFGKGVLFITNAILNGKRRRMGTRICLVNPFNRTWRQLPDLLVKAISGGNPAKEPSLETVSLMGEEDGGFQVYVLHMCRTSRYMGDPFYVSVSVYSSWAHEWTNKFILYEEPDNEINLAEADLVVGQKYVYALRQDVNRSSHWEAEVFKASSGRHVCTLAPPTYCDVEDYKLGLVQHEQGEYMVLVPTEGGTCKILSLPERESEDWDEVSLPKALARKMAPGVDLSSEFDSSDPDSPHYAGPQEIPFEAIQSWVWDMQVAGTSVILSLSVGSKWHVVVYDYILGTWKLVLSHFWGGEGTSVAEALLPWEHVLEKHDVISYLEPRPSFRVGMADYPPVSAE